MGGNVLRPGNRALGYDLRSVNVSGLDTEGFEGVGADFYLVKRFYKKRRGKRAWELRRLDREKEETNGIQWNDDADMEAVCQDLEEDPELRQKVNMYRSADQAPSASVASVPAGGQSGEQE